MNRKQRIFLILGAICILHSSMVPPVSQAEAGTCRYQQFMERSSLFTQGYAVEQGDVTALHSEYGVIVAVTLIAFLLSGGSKAS